MFKFFLGLRFKLVLLSGFLFTIPWLGYQYVWEMEKFLREGQEKTLTGTVSALATALHERPNLFNTKASFLQQVEKGKDLYAYPINSAIQLDGKLKDWNHYKKHALMYSEQNIIEHNKLTEQPSDQQLLVQEYQSEDLSFIHLVGQYGNYLYAYFEVTDNNVIYRPSNLLSVDQNDHLRISVLTPSGEFERFIISPKQAGWINAYTLSDDRSRLLAAKFSNNIQGYWRQTDQGYNIELRMPLSLFSHKLSFAIADYDAPFDEQKGNQAPKYVIGTAHTQTPDNLGSVLVPSPEIERIIKGMAQSESRIWVVDKHRRVLASSGDLTQSHGIWSSQNKHPAPASWWHTFEQQYLHPLYYRVLTRPPESFVDQLYDSAQLEGKHISHALNGQTGSHWRLSSDNQAVILSAAHPIWIDGQVMGAVIAEETTNGIRTLRNKALEKLFNVILAVLCVGTLVLFLFASRISSRIRHLRDQAEQAIDAQGRITDIIHASKSHDEIGDLSRSFASVVSRLGQYTHYLENMSSRLSHELRTPVAVVRSSLDNLAMNLKDSENQKYMARAQEGISRLNTILTNMSEATRLEQTLKDSERIPFNLTDVVTGCMQGYQLAYRDTAFELELTDQPLSVVGCPDYIAQLLDKLVANACDFSDNSPIEVTLFRQGNQAIFSITNYGAQLPNEMKDRIFDSMVSVRSQNQQQQPHLGIGLYIARMITLFHEGAISGTNNCEENSVTIMVTLPLSSE
ncbi:proteobacterial dedicated sortase system histidine kinase [Flocculibacter collagenilyticus]|uniref:proteobacterial dedicated sortase system histidine kinase n=1 Tax=Flocculibacter collagenilyticus TaxID=2744479 RepID=UPI0018F47141|nr:proteobacterial dedicated sortase system histidine kinase [Flocculibacter collagenilyticus]